MTQIVIPQLSEQHVFPHPLSNSSTDVLAMGGDLDPDRILLAYHYGIFPWYDDTSPILWWSPRERFVLRPGEVKVSKSMRNIFNRGIYRYTIDQDFDAVIEACDDSSRNESTSGWLLPEMKAAYKELHRRGYAHSVEVWDKDDQLVGGLYGMAIGKCFFGESMFTKASNASKFGFISLCRHLDEIGYELVDGQMPNDHLASLGFGYLDREQFVAFLRWNHFQEKRM